MPNPTTPNLGLNKIDRTSPETTYFDLNKYIDQNAEKVDSFAGEVLEEISTLQDRLDHVETKEITLNPGLQVVNSPRDSRFKLGEIKGRTLINLLGNAGSCEEATSWSAPNGTLSVDTTVRDSGMASLKYTHSSSALSGAYVRSDYFPIDPTKYLLIAAWVKSASKSISVRLVTTGEVTIQHSFDRSHPAGEAGGISFRVFTPADLGTNTSVCVDVYCNELFAVGDTFNFDSYRVYQLTAEEYAQLNESTPDSWINEKYLFVPAGIVGVENPYVIGYGENILPPFYEWRVPASSTGEVKIKGAYEIDLIGAASVGSARSYTVKVLPNTNYTYSAVHNGFISVTAGADIIVNNTPDQAVTFNTGNHDEVVVNIYNNLLAGVFTFKNPMLVVGNEAKPFIPQRKSMLALQTTLHANPLDGSEPDVLFDKEGQYFKLAKWKKVVLDNSFSYSLNASYAGFKSIKIVLNGKTGALENYSPNTENLIRVTGWDGKQLTWLDGGGWTEPSQYFNVGNIQFELWITIPNADSGWGADYTPTADEIKAYFLGWKMSVLSSSRQTNYNGTGTKSWIRITRMNDSVPLTNSIDYTTTVPTTFAGTDSFGNVYQPYQLLYRLAREVVEPVPFEGALVLPEGQNVVEVGTGIVLRENVRPFGSTTKYFNSTASPFANKVDSILKMYEDNREFSKWGLSTNDTYGKVRAAVNDYNYNANASYSATYIKLDKSPTQPIKGSVADNEKAQISDLVEVATNALTAASVASTAATSGSAIKTVVPYVTTKNGDTFIIPTNDRLSANQQITVKFNADSTGTPSLQFGSTAAYPIKKANGSAAKFYASVYTLFFDGSAFILSGEGGEVESYGTATTSDVLATKTILTESGLVAGTMPNRGAVTNTITTQNGQYTIPAGYHNGSGKVTATFANLVAGNVKSGINIGGVVGSLQPGGYAELSFNLLQQSAPPGTTALDILTVPAGMKHIVYSSDYLTGSTPNTEFTPWNGAMTIALKYGTGPGAGGSNITLGSYNGSRFVWNFEINFATNYYQILYKNGTGGTPISSKVNFTGLTSSTTNKLWLEFANSAVNNVAYNVYMYGALVYG
ncbi:hypothetical protein M3G15_11425 [Paenibacillus sp. p3-SID1389]|uniref:hypothetical protein n=1 Tax=Paenibacillus sp. p3-SID1389 TaxID=2916364 RepID=UPI0021A4A240|nr:hypothetical protein [Paenibacillus sp. p3-SID1389]MCT2195749.1 hypothetical protein [Paenibacillus sp. p3-SID1389]